MCTVQANGNPMEGTGRTFLSGNSRDGAPRRPSASARRAYVRGFTLLEILLAMAILGMMSLAIYRFVQSNLLAVHASAEASAAEVPFEALRNLLTEQWQRLPQGRGGLSGEPLKLNERQRDEIRWKCSAGSGLLTRYAAGEFMVRLRLRPESEKSDRLDLGILRTPVNDTGSGGESWVPLITNVRSLQISYFEPRVNTWVDRWGDGARLPRLVKLIIGRSDTSVPWEAIIPLSRTPF